MTVKSFIFAFCAVLFLINNHTYAKSGGVFRTGTNLLNNCSLFIKLAEGKDLTSLDQAFNIGLCAGFIEGIIKSEYTHKDKKLFCSPKESIKIDQAVRIVVKYVNDNPQNLHSDSILLVFSALMKAFPCPK